ncbi:E3 ubiquitin-protein ligase TRIM71-like [Patiria miniata]|uniref:Uncharacterized protein n=1 Tax=Patiria miniata TaxID=46514 RepID=A0A913ZRA4_PATMI|nr:E3 ubiquitin-protein ligase TRIM71-like [Patiria miniata]
MASSVTAQSDLEKVSVDHLECSICTNRFRQPKLLDCLHSFCLQCLHDLRQSQDPSGTKLTCPLCTHETMLKGSGVADLPNNFAFSALVEEVTMQEKLLEGQGSKIKCQNCDEENQAVSRCMDCDNFLCEECQKAHARMAVMKSHKIYTLAQFQSGEIVYKSKLREEVPKCGKHPDQNLNVYCNTCQQVICTTCSVLDHAKHTLTGLPEAVEKCEKKVTEMVRKSERRKTELGTTIEDTCKSCKELETMFAKTQKKISKKAQQKITKLQQEITKLKQEVAKIQKEITKIQKEEKKLLKETDMIYKDKLKAFEAVQATNRKEVTQTEHKLEEVKQLMNQASCYEILELQQKLLHNLSELTGKQPQQVPDKLTFMDFEEGERSLGRLILKEEPKAAAKQSPRPARSCVKEKWKLKTEFKKIGLIIDSIFSCKLLVSALSNNEILALRRFFGISALFTVSMPNGQHTPSPIPQRLQISGLTDDVRCIAVSRDDKLLAVDGQVVKVFNKQHQLLHQFTPGRGSDSQPTCLAVDDSNLIAVGYKEKKEISLHNPDGSLIRRLPAPMIGGYLTMYNHRLIYTNYGKKRLVCVDYYGASVFSVDMTSNIQGGNWHPDGVCCDSDGSIYVVVYGYPTGDILHYSPDGKYIGWVIKGCDDPRGMTFTSGGELVVAAGDSVQVYHRV